MFFCFFTKNAVNKDFLKKLLSHLSSSFRFNSVLTYSIFFSDERAFSWSSTVQKQDTPMIYLIGLLMSVNFGLVSVNRIKLSLKEPLSQLHARGRCASRHSCVLGQRKSQGRFTQRTAFFGSKLLK